MTKLRQLFALALLLLICNLGWASVEVSEDSLVPCTREELLGKFNPAKHTGFQLIESPHSTKAEIYLRKEAYEAFKRMHEAALKEGIHLTILSATRNFDSQKGIWERKWKRPQYEGKTDIERIVDIMKFSSMPGTSRHHWGTDIDLNSLEPAYFTQGKGLSIYQWLNAHASDYGYYQTYTSKQDGRSGYEEEAWHWSYMPLAKPMLDNYNRLITYQDLSGFSGCASADKARVLEDFVNGIAPELKK
jgi:LAS superfamily LD-carboxypeptidase LdcB